MAIKIGRNHQCIQSAFERSTIRKTYIVQRSEIGTPAEIEPLYAARAAQNAAGIPSLYIDHPNDDTYSVTRIVSNVPDPNDAVVEVEVTWTQHADLRFDWGSAPLPQRTTLGVPVGGSDAEIMTTFRDGEPQVQEVDIRRPFSRVVATTRTLAFTPKQLSQMWLNAFNDDIWSGDEAGTWLIRNVTVQNYDGATVNLFVSFDMQWNPSGWSTLLTHRETDPSSSNFNRPITNPQPGAAVAWNIEIFPANFGGLGFTLD